MKILKYIFLASILIIQFSCSVEEAEPSTISRFKSFGFEGIADKYTFLEADTSIQIPFSFNDDQIFDFTVELTVGANSTATEDVDFALGSHTIPVQTLEKSGVIDFIIGTDVFLESDETVYLTLSSDNLSGLPVTKTIEITIKNVGGCPEYVQNEFVGTYTVESDEWADWTPGTELEVENVGPNSLSFKYNCGANALPIILNIDPSSFEISGDKQEYCSYELPPLTKFFGDVNESSSIVNTCDKTLTISIAHSDANGNAYGSGIIVLKKK